ncbi:MAG: MFS transporter, partial [Muribaculaceae bacterium]|nr:MFS transporter [Muribaculaceae bacterium]
GFMLFEICLNGGPHLITFIIPAHIFPVANRGKGTGMASLLGKIGAIAGVFFMPMLLHAGGMTLVLIVTGATMLLGAAISIVYGRLLGLL